MTEIKMHQYALLEDTRDPANTKYIYGPTLFRLGTYSLSLLLHPFLQLLMIFAENPYQQLGRIEKVPVLDQNDYIVVVDRTGVKRTVQGPTVFITSFFLIIVIIVLFIYFEWCRYSNPHSENSGQKWKRQLFFKSTNSLLSRTGLKLTSLSGLLSLKIVITVN